MGAVLVLGAAIGAVGRRLDAHGSSGRSWCFRFIEEKCSDVLLSDSMYLSGTKIYAFLRNYGLRQG